VKPRYPLGRVAALVAAIVPLGQLRAIGPADRPPLTSRRWRSIRLTPDSQVDMIINVAPTADACADPSRRRSPDGYAAATADGHRESPLLRVHCRSIAAAPTAKWRAANGPAKSSGERSQRYAAIYFAAGATRRRQLPALSGHLFFSRAGRWMSPLARWGVAGAADVADHFRATPPFIIALPRGDKEGI